MPPAGRERHSGPQTPPIFRFFTEVGIVWQLARAILERVMPEGLSYAQFSILNHFVRLGGERSLVELARTFQVTKPAMTKLVRKLEEGGFVTVRANPRDSRGKQVAITGRGLAARQSAVAALAPVLEELRTAFGDEAFAEAEPFLARWREWLETRR